MAPHQFYPIVILCDGCRSAVPMELSTDEADPNKGLLVKEIHLGHCNSCNYDFHLTVQMEEKGGESKDGIDEESDDESSDS